MFWWWIPTTAGAIRSDRAVWTKSQNFFRFSKEICLEIYPEFVRKFLWEFFLKFYQKSSQVWILSGIFTWIPSGVFHGVYPENYSLGFHPRVFPISIFSSLALDWFLKSFNIYPKLLKEFLLVIFQKFYSGTFLCAEVLSRISYRKCSEISLDFFLYFTRGPLCDFF